MAQNKSTDQSIVIGWEQANVHTFMIFMIFSVIIITKE